MLEQKLKIKKIYTCCNFANVEISPLKKKLRFKNNKYDKQVTGKMKIHCTGNQYKNTNSRKNSNV